MSTIPFGFWGQEDYVFLDPADYPDHCWSFWLRNPNYTGSCIRVQRSSDSTQQDFGFVNNFLDVDSIVSWVGAGTGYLVTWYDQFGTYNLSNVYAGNTGFMPRLIISGGAFQTFSNGTPTIQFGNGSNSGYSQLSGADGVQINRSPGTVYWTTENGNSVSNAPFGYDNNNGYFARQEINGAGADSVYYDTISAETDAFYINESKRIGGFNTTIGTNANDVYQANAYNISVEAPKLWAIRGNQWNSLGDRWVIGGRYGNTNDYFRGKLNECLVYNDTVHTETKLKEIQALLNVAHQAYDTTDFEKDLVLWYDAGDTNSYPGTGTTVTDLGPSNVSAVLVNTTYSSNDGGKFVFDGSGDWIGTNSDTIGYPWIVGTGDFSIECWVRPNNTNQTAILFGNRSNSNFSQLSLWHGNMDQFGSLTAGKRLSVALVNQNATRAGFYKSTNEIIDGNWKHIVVTRINKDIKLYINSVDTEITLQGSIGGTSFVHVNSGTAWRMSDNGSGTGGGTGGNYSGDGAIYRLYKCALSQAQVIRNFNLEKSRFGF